MNDADAIEQFQIRKAWLREAGFILFVLVVAAALRFYRLDAGLWQDEVLTYRGASHSLHDAFSHRAQFLYYVLAHCTLQLGDNEAMLRLPSVVAGIAGVAALYGLARQTCGRTTAFLAAAMLAIAPYHVDKSQEARFYAFVMLANVLMVWSLWNAVSRGHAKAWIGFILAANLGVASQFTVVPYVAALGFAAAVWLVFFARDLQWDQRRRRLYYLVFASILAYAGLAMSIGTRGMVPNPITRGVRTAGEQISGVAYINSYRLTLGQYLEFIHLYIPRYWTWHGYVFLALLLIGGILLAKRRPLLAFLMAAQTVLVPLPLFFVNVHHWYHERYFCSVYPFVPLLIATAVTVLGELVAGVFARGVRLQGWKPERIAALASIAIVLIFLAGYVKISSGLLVHNFRYGRLHDWKGVVEYLSPQLTSGDVIAVAGSAVYATRYAPKERQVFPTSNPALEYYLERSLDASTLGKISVVGAGSKSQIDSLRNDARPGNVYLVIEECWEPERVPHESVNALPATPLLNANGLEVRRLELSRAGASQ
jgi:4-amino-4-deoxy-L-arabinose transferase-like glycosyltransferase